MTTVLAVIVIFLYDNRYGMGALVVFSTNVMSGEI